MKILCVFLCISVVSAVISKITDADVSVFKNSVLNSESIIYFHAKWCGACKSYGPYFEKWTSWAASEIPEMKIFSIDYSESPAIAARFGITRLPTLIHGLPGGVFRDISTHRNELTSLLNDKEKLLAISTTSLGPFSIYGDFMNSIGQTGSRLAEMIESLLRQPTYILILLALLMVFAVVALAYLLVFLHETIFPSQTDNIGYKKLPTREEMLSEELKSDEEIDSEQETSDPSQSLNSIEFSSDESDQGDNEDDASPSETTIISEGKNKQLADDDGFITVRRRK